MSVRVQTYVWQLELKPGEKLVALAMADHCHDDGSEARPSRATVAKKCGMSERQVTRIIHQLVNLGVMELERESGHHRTNVYRFPLPEDFATIGKVVKSSPQPVDSPVNNKESGVTFATSCQKSGVTSATSGVTSATLRGDTGVTLTIREPSLEPSEDLLPRFSENPKSAVTEIPFASECEALWNAYPRKVNRTRATKAMTTLLKKGVPFERLLDATLNYATVRAGLDPEFTMHAATFFGPHERWKDFLSGGAAMTEVEKQAEPAFMGVLERFIGAS